MPVNSEQFKIDPYTSTVPLVQLPVQDMYSGAKTNPNVWGGKGTSALAIGDSLLKGFMQGHQLKEQKKQAQAQATINAADSASEAAYQTYQDTLTKSGGNDKDPAAQAAYDAYKTTFMAGKQAKAQFVLPDKTQKGKKSASESASSAGTGGTGGKDKKQPHAGFNNIRDFFEANPHIVPQIALMTMQPKPQGLSPQREAQSLELDTAKRQNQEEQRKVNDRNMIAMYGKLTPEEIAKLPVEEQKKINDPQSGLAVAKNRYAMENRDKAKPDWFVDESGNFHQVAVGEEPPPGWKKYEKSPVNESQSNMYYDAAARAWGTTRDKLSVQQLEYVDALRARSKAQSSGQTTYSYSTTDVSGDRRTITKKVSDPIPPPAGVNALPEGALNAIQQPPVDSQQASPASGPITKPNAPAAAPVGQGKPGSGPIVHPKTLSAKPIGKQNQRIDRPPQPGEAVRATAGSLSRGKSKTLTEANRELADIDKQAAIYRTAAKDYKTEVDRIQKKYKDATDTGAMDRELAEAKKDFEDAKALAVRQQRDKILAVGGIPWKTDSRGVQFLNDKQGKTYGTMDGVNWVDTVTGEPYKEQ